MPSSELLLTSGDSIPVLGEDDYYKFLGKFENSVQLEKKVSELASEEFVRRLHIVWSSLLTVPRKVKATNCFAINTCSTVPYVVQRLADQFTPGTR